MHPTRLAPATELSADERAEYHPNRTRRFYHVPKPDRTYPEVCEFCAREFYRQGANDIE